MCCASNRWVQSLWNGGYLIHLLAHVCYPLQSLHGSRWTLSRLFLFYSSFIDFYILLHCIVTLGWNIVNSAGTRNETPGGARGEDGGRAAEDGGWVIEDGGRAAEDRAIDVWIYEGCLRCNRSTSATDASPSSSTCSKYCFRHCESLHNLIITVSSLCRINLTKMPIH